MMQAPVLNIFENHRSQLIGVVYRITGSAFEGEDIVHETFLKWCDADHETIQSPYSWLVTVATRLSLDYLKSAKVKRQSYIGPWLPEPLIADNKIPENELEIDQTVTMALMLVLETLSPAERAAFVLHDIFNFDFEEVAHILEKSGPACRKLASRARSKLKQTERLPAPDLQKHKMVVSAFFDAVKSGNINNLVAQLKDDVILHADGGGKAEAARNILTGNDVVSAFLIDKVTGSFSSRLSVAHTLWFNGSYGLVIEYDGVIISAFNFEILDQKISRIHALRNPDKLRLFEKQIL